MSKPLLSFLHRIYVCKFPALLRTWRSHEYRLSVHRDDNLNELTVHSFITRRMHSIVGRALYCVERNNQQQVTAIKNGSTHEPTDVPCPLQFLLLSASAGSLSPHIRSLSCSTVSAQIIGGLAMMHTTARADHKNCRQRKRYAQAGWKLSYVRVVCFSYGRHLYCDESRRPLCPRKSTSHPFRQPLWSVSGPRRDTVCLTAEPSPSRRVNKTLWTHPCDVTNDMQTRCVQCGQAHQKLPGKRTVTDIHCHTHNSAQGLQPYNALGDAISYVGCSIQKASSATLPCS